MQLYIYQGLRGGSLYTQLSLISLCHASSHLSQVLLKQIWKIKGKDNLLWGEISSVEASCHGQLLLLGWWPKATRNAKTHKAALKELPVGLSHKVISWGVHTRPIRRNCKSGYPGILQGVEKSILTAEGHRQRYIAEMPFRNPFCKVCYTKKETQSLSIPWKFDGADHVNFPETILSCQWKYETQWLQKLCIISYIP